jgi:hypothetical protein
MGDLVMTLPAKKALRASPAARPSGGRFARSWRDCLSAAFFRNANALFGTGFQPDIQPPSLPSGRLVGLFDAGRMQVAPIDKLARHFDACQEIGNLG